MKQLMMIGFGSMAREVVALLPEDLNLQWLLVPADSVAAARGQVSADVRVISTIDAVNAACDGTPDLVVECAGQGAIREHGEAVLARGWDLGVISVGAFADNALLDRLQSAAVAGKARIHALAGAIAGIDGLAAAKEGGLDEVVYCSRKSPKSWRGSPAETLIDLDAITEPTVFYRGTAREAALLFPANANVAATIALAGIGMDDTRVELMADPGIERNQHLICARGRFGDMKLELSGLPLESNPKTSTLAALSVVRACRHSTASLLI
uniref:aspartate dehydrogenase n=1 Tax=Marinobacterium profundum TaxID=1714300 RepID=UPI00082FD156|nr:aspartate dehydrogenase [Marinobacterium profundum]